MREYKNRADDQRRKGPAAVSRWPSGDRISTDLRERKFLSSYNFRGDDWSSWSNEFNFALTWVGYKLAITVASLTAFFTGIGELLFKLTRH